MTVPGTIAPLRPTAIGPEAGARGPHGAPRAGRGTGTAGVLALAASGRGSRPGPAAAGALGQEGRRTVETGGAPGHRGYGGGGGVVGGGTRAVAARGVVRVLSPGRARGSRHPTRNPRHRRVRRGVSSTIGVPTGSATGPDDSATTPRGAPGARGPAIASSTPHLRRARPAPPRGFPEPGTARPIGDRAYGTPARPSWTRRAPATPVTAEQPQVGAAISARRGGAAARPPGRARALGAAASRRRRPRARRGRRHPRSARPSRRGPRPRR